MAFPDDPLGVVVELFVGGAWVDITGDVLTTSPITINRGRRDEAATVDKGTCELLLINRGGRYSPRNPRSDLYGLIGRNTQVRVSIQPDPDGPRLVRFVGEISAWPPKWSTAHDVTVPVQAAGILRRLNQGATPLQSTLRREFSSPSRTSIVAYWPLEDGANATEFASAMSGAAPMRITTAGVKPGAYSDYAASEALPTLDGGALSGVVPAYTPTGQTAARMVVAFPEQAPTVLTPLLTLHTTGSIRRWEILWHPAGTLAVRGRTATGVVVTLEGWGEDLRGRLVHLGLDLVQTGSNVERRAYYLDAGRRGQGGGFLVFSSSGTHAGTVGRITNVVASGEGLGDVAVGHVVLATSTAAYAATGNAMIAWAGETAGDRLLGLTNEEGVPFIYRGVLDAVPTRLGPQIPAALLDLIQSAADTDGGILYEQRDALGLVYRTRANLYTQAPALTLDYSAQEVAEPFEPVDDDQGVTNDATIAREGGSSARAVLETGPLSILAPPDGIGRYAQSTTLNLATDEQCKPWAWWRLHRGTWDAPRFPSVSVEVHTAPHLAAAVAAVDVGDRATVANPPDWLPPEQVEGLVMGYEEVLTPRTWDIEFTCSPGGPWLVATLDDEVYGRADTDGSRLATAATATGSTLDVQTTAGPTWTTAPAEFPFDVALGGEAVTVTAITDISAGRQRFTVNRAVNGVTKAHPTGTLLGLAHPAYTAL